MVSDDKIDSKVISDFGDEWAEYGYASNESASELALQFQKYSSLVNFNDFDPRFSSAADFGAGTGRWAQFILKNFRMTYLVEPSDGAFQVLKNKFLDNENVILENSTISNCSVPNVSLDFAMSLGVLHHISDTAQALKDINAKLKNGGIFLGYLYYRVDDKPLRYRLVFWIVNSLRRLISFLPFRIKKNLCLLIAAFIYFPLAKLSKLLNAFKFDASNIPLHQYASLNFYMMKNDALDRFGTKLEKRFNKEEISALLEKNGFDPASICFSESEPFWTFTVRKLN